MPNKRPNLSHFGHKVAIKMEYGKQNIRQNHFKTQQADGGDPACLTLPWFSTVSPGDERNES